MTTSTGPKLVARRWRKSEYSDRQNCVEIAHIGADIKFRDSKQGESGPTLAFPGRALDQLTSTITTASKRQET